MEKQEKCQLMASCNSIYSVTSSLIQQFGLLNISPHMQIGRASVVDQEPTVIL